MCVEGETEPELLVGALSDGRIGRNKHVHGEEGAYEVCDLSVEHGVLLCCGGVFA